MKSFEHFLFVLLVHVFAEVHAHHLIIGITEIGHCGSIEKGQVPFQVNLVIGFLHIVEDIPVTLFASPVPRLTLPQRLFRPPAISDIPALAENGNRFPVFVPDKAEGVLCPYHAAISAVQFKFQGSL